MIQLQGVTRTFGKGDSLVVALDHVNLEIADGEFVTILGASGAGKTTLLNILGGMDRMTEGSYLMDGEEVGRYDEKQLSIFRRLRIGFVFQFYNLMPNLTALENVKLSGNLVKSGMDAQEALRLVGLEARQNNFPSMLSGGEQQRVSIARAIVKNPKLLLCDEPTGALDSKTGSGVLSMLIDLCKEQKRTTIVVTHNAEIAKVADRIVTISDGKIIGNTVQEKPLKADELVW